MKNNIIILENSVQKTGAFISIFEFSIALAHQFNIKFSLNRNSILKEKIQKDNFKILPLQFIEIQKNANLILYFPFLIYNSIKLLLYMKRNQIEVIHVNDIYNMVGILAKILNPNIYLIYHIRLRRNSYISSMYNTWAFLINKFSDKIICVSNTVANSFPYKSPKITVIYDSINTDLLMDKKFQKLNNGKIKLYYIGNYIKGKGQDMAIIAFSKAYKANPNLSLTFVGGTLGKKKNQVYKEKLIEETHKLKIDNCVTFESFHSDMDWIYRQADIILNFSESESFSMVCLEALAYGKPLIATDSGGPSEIIDNEIDGLLIPNKDIDQMKDAILKLSADQSLMKKFALNGPKKVKKKFNLEELKDKLGDIYQKGFLSLEENFK